MGPALMLAAVLVTGYAVWSGASSEANQDRPGFTQVWLVPDQQDASTARLGLANFEGHTTEYRVRLLSNGIAVREWGPIKVESSDRWEGPSIEVNPAVELTVELYRADRPGLIYRTVRLKARE